MNSFLMKKHIVMVRSCADDDYVAKSVLATQIEGTRPKQDLS